MEVINKTILDPKQLGGDKFNEYNQKISVSKVALAKSPEKGGMPFIFAFTSVKNHTLDEVKMPYLNKDGDVEFSCTAATDGKEYKWSPQILDILGPREVAIITAHETYHIVLQHCNAHRAFGKHKMAWALAIDYVVNGMIEHDLIQSNQISQYDCDKARTNGNHPIWKNGIGGTKGPVYFDELMKDIEKTLKQLAEDKKKGKKSVVPTGNIAEKQPKPQVIRPYADYKLYGRSAEDIYDEIMKKMEEEAKKNGMKLSDLLSPGDFHLPGGYVIGGGSMMDEHKENDISRTKLLEEVMDAVSAARALSAGNMPSAIEDQLKALQEPKLKWQDIVRHALQTTRQEKGTLNDWTRMRRRLVSYEIFVPKKKDQRVRWLCMLDTSGSMSDDDIVYGVSQLKVLDGRSKGIVVPCDAQCYWDHAVEIHGMSDLPKVKPVGRGGTVFTDFFENYEKKIAEEIDLIIVITDGYLYDLDMKKPAVDCVWVITNDNEFKAPFGRTAPLRSY